MYKKVNYERRLSVMVHRYCRLLDSKALSNDEIKSDINLSCIDFSFDWDCFIQRAQYWSAHLYFEVRTRQTHRDASARVLVF